MSDQKSPLTPRDRVKTSMRHEAPDRVPVDFLATPEVWEKLYAALKPDTSSLQDMTWLQPEREAVMRRLEVDCRVISYDMFCAPPASALKPGARVDQFVGRNRSTPQRMWRQVLPDDTLYDIWGTHSHLVENAFGVYEEFVEWVLSGAQSVEDLKPHAWPEPDWWDFSSLPAILRRMDRDGEWHVRFRVGSIFEIGWQLRGMQEFLLDLINQPEIPEYIMDRLLEIYLENLRRVLDLAGDRLDMIYFYDDVATQNSLMISPEMWRKYIRPRHQRIVDLAHRYGKPVMYHCDGAIYPLIPELIEMGIDVLNPVQPDAKGMQSERLKKEFGDRLTFHGGVDIINVLPRGTPEEVDAETRARVQMLGPGGGYILCSSHHIQPDTPVANVLTMYDLSHRYLR
ncbi:MAG: hypothetical protein HY023_05875 [Chloroflexi bacterium]|nr:hypothetical protein [Chloroflexota bacterium]